MFRKKLNLRNKIKIYNIINKYIKYEKYVIILNVNYEMVYVVYFTPC